jgi:hypothetical protein
MEFVLKTVERKGDKPENRDKTQYVRKNWSIFSVYYLVTSSAVGCFIGMTMFLFLIFDHSNGRHQPIPVQDAVHFSLVIIGFVSVLAFLIQSLTGAFVFTKDVVCRKCHTRLKVNRIAFFTGRYSRPPRCECGGKIDPAFLWKPQTASHNTN